MDSLTRIQELCDDLKKHPLHDDKIIRDLEMLNTKYEHFGKRRTKLELSNKRIREAKERGAWNLMIQLKEEYINEHTDERRKWLRNNDYTSQIMINEYNQIVRAFDSYFSTGIVGTILLKKYETRFHQIG